MRDNEFSHPREEFSAPGQEFFPLRQEFFLSGKEQLPGGEEFHQTAKPPEQKKKKRINPLMLTAAAVVTTSIVITTAPQQKQLAPKYPLTAEQCAYLDALDEALVQQDSDALLTLLLSPSLQELEETAVKPYYEMLLPIMDDWTYHHLYQQEHYSDTHHYTSMSFTYDGESLGAEWDYDETEDSFGLSYISRGNTIDQPAAVSNAYIYKNTPVEHHDVSTKFHHYNFGIAGLSDDGTPTHWYMEDYLVQTQKVPGGYDHGVPLEGQHIEKNENVLHVLEGTFALEQYVPENGNMGYLYDSFLHDGIITVYLETDGMWKEQRVVTVKDGYTIMEDGLELKTSQETGYSHDTLYVSLEDGTKHPLEYPDSASGKDPFYHMFKIY